ncbi:MAG: amino acid ABC transporter substrate-binding protein [Lachnospiraceae bacterium]|nr:amino acid ABC transporter substrate-binding protein [Lachnospiraceae bacterium]
MKKTLAMLLCGAMTMALLVGCGNGSADATQTATEETEATETTEVESETETTEETEAANPEADRTTFVVGFDAEYPPYGYMDDNGEYTGFDLELAQAVCDMEGWELTKTPIDWDSKDMELNSGSIDCIWNGFTINGREDDYTWSDPYCDNSQVIVVAKDSSINTLADLAGKNVGVQTASAALSVLSDEEQQKALADTFGSLQQFSDYNSAFSELLAGSLDAIAIDIGVANYQISSRGEGYVILSETLNSEQYGVGFKLGNESLRDIVNADLKKLAEDGTVAELAEKYGISDLICLK